MIDMSMNFKFNMSSVKYLSDFNKVTIESEKDLPVLLLNQFYSLSIGQSDPGKQKDGKKLI